MKSLLTKTLTLLLTITLSTCLIPSVVYAENNFGIPDTLVGLIPSSINQYAPSKLIPYDAGKFRDFEIPMNESTSYYKANVNPISESNYSEISYLDFRTAFYKIFNNPKQNTRLNRKNVFYAKFYEYTSSSNGRRPTGRYAIILYAVTCLENRSFYPFDINYLDPYDIGNNSGTVDRDHTNVEYARDHLYDPVLNTYNENIGIDFETLNVEYYSCSTTFDSNVNIPYAVYESSTNAWFVNQDLLDDNKYYLNSNSVDKFCNYFNYLNPNCFSSSTLINPDDQCKFGYYCDSQGENSIFSLFSTIQYKDTFSKYKNSYNRNGCNDTICTSNDTNGVYCFSYYRLIEQDLRVNGFTLNGVKQHDLYNIFSSTDLPNNDPFSANVLFNIVVTSNNSEYGTVSGDISVQKEAGESIEITANPISNEFKFLRWSDGNTDQTRTITVSGNLTLQAIFTPKVTYTVTLNAEPEIAGHFEVNDVYYEGDTAEFKAVPYKAYTFSHWSDGSEEAIRSIDDINENHELTAYFVAGGSSGNFDAGPIITVLIVCAFLLMLRGF